MELWIRVQQWEHIQNIERMLMRGWLSLERKEKLPGERNSKLCFQNFERGSFLGGANYSEQDLPSRKNVLVKMLMSDDTWMDKEDVVPIHNGILVVKGKNWPLAETWMNLEIILLSEISQTKKDKYHMISFICRCLDVDLSKLKEIYIGYLNFIDHIIRYWSDA